MHKPAEPPRTALPAHPSRRAAAQTLERASSALEGLEAQAVGVQSIRGLGLPAG
jgi:hypothetical protein